MAQQSFEAFKESAMSRGFEEVVERKWGPKAELPEHTHPFAVEVRVVHGTMWLTVRDGETRRFGVGEGFSLEPNVPHAERYGDEGTIYWVARRHATA